MSSIVSTGLSSSEKFRDPVLSSNAITVLKKRYLRRDKFGRPTESIKDLFIRVATHLADLECFKEERDRPLSLPSGKVMVISKDDLEKIFYDMMIDGYFEPNTPTLFNAGTGNKMSLSACFVIIPEDDLDSILSVGKEAGVTQKAGGGVGYNFSKLRPRGSLVRSCGASTDGPLPFIDTYCAITEAIQQGSKRRGAQMGILSVYHPDIWDFIQAKSDLSRWKNMNVSVQVDKEFLKNCEIPSKAHVVRHPEWGEGVLVRTEDGSVVHKRCAFTDSGKPLVDEPVVTCSELFEEICRRAWSTGEPGLFFVDRANEDWVFKNSGILPLEGTNPCGEQVLENYGSCNLGSINLSKFVKNGPEGPIFDFYTFEKYVVLSTLFLNAVVEKNEFPIDKMGEVNRLTRRIGLGIMGWADTLFKLWIRYGSKESLELAEKISESLYKTAEWASETLYESGWFPMFEAYPKSDLRKPRANAYLTTIAPTGTISIIADCSGGIEPIFSLSFMREVMKDDQGKHTIMQETNKIFKNVLSCWLKDNNVTDVENAINEICEYAYKHGSIQDANIKGVTDLPGWDVIKNVFVCTADVTPEEHVRMQAAWQKHIDNAVSKTINMPRTSSVEDVKKAYKLAGELGCKGITVYVDGCREGKAGQKQPMKLGSTKEEPKEEGRKINLIQTADIEDAIRVRLNTPLGKMHIKCVYSREDGAILELFGQIESSGTMPMADLEAICRLSSLILRMTGSTDLLMKQLKKIKTSYSYPTRNGSITSIPEAVSVAISLAEEAIKERVRKNIDIPVENMSQDSTTNVTSGGSVKQEMFEVKCPECGSPMSFTEGCEKCSSLSCGFSKC